MHAHLILATVIGCYFFLSKIPFQSAEQEQHVVDANNVPTRAIPVPKNFELGKNVFQSNCGSCHVLFRDMTGPGLAARIDQEPWSDRNNLYDWISNPSVFMQKNDYTRKLKESYKVTMPAFPGLSHNDIDAIVDYIVYSRDQEANRRSLKFF
jgi:mono/diheme cytochrome c family protein